MQHTPGPWEFDEFNGIVHVGGRIVAGTDHGNSVATRRIDDENGRLISAAPDLLAALKLLMSDIYQGADPSDKECQRITGSWGKARAAIAKATGLTEG